MRIARKGGGGKEPRELWGAHAERHHLSDAGWRAPVLWNREAELDRKRRRVFCGSLCDVGENRPDLDAPRARLLVLIAATPWLDWQLLTKRPGTWLELLERIVRRGSAAGAPERDVEAAQIALLWLAGKPPRNVWMGTTVEDKRRALERVPHLYRIPALVHFVSCEPLLEAVSLPAPRPGIDPPLDWIIIGGESESEAGTARPFALEWASDLIDQALAMGAAPFVKQLGAFVVSEARTIPVKDALDLGWNPVVAANGEAYAWRAGLVHRKGGEIDEWPPDLQVREMPRVRT